MTTHYQHILEAVSRNPEQRKNQNSLVGDEEQEELLTAYNGTAREYSQNPSVPELFERRVVQAPDAPAVICGNDSVTYAQLNEKANRLANYLVKLGVQSEANEPVVAVMLSRSVDLIVALLAVLKAGAAYIPLDPDNPRDRLHFMLADTGARFVLTEAQLVEKLQGTKAFCICVDTEKSQISAAAPDN